MLAKFLFSTIVTLISFIGISYQYLICHTLGQFSQNEGLNQSITLGFYLLSMGIGAAFAEKFLSKNGVSKIYLVEIIVAIVGALMVPLIYLTHGFINIFLAIETSAVFYGMKALFTFQLVTIFIGFLTGFELPLLMKISEGDSRIGLSSSKVLAFSYLGTLLSSIASTSNILLKNDFIASGILLGMLSMLAASLVYVTNIREIKKTFVILLVIPIGLGFYLAQQKEEITQRFLKQYYVNIKVPLITSESIRTVWKFISTIDPVERYVTKYQIIDILPDSFMSQYDREENFTLYLNNQIQFGRKNYDMYHETMVHGSINITDTSPKDVLILGGGDGLIATELKKIQNIQSITQVELDSQMVDLANNHEVLREMNKNVYQNTKIEIFYDDAFSYVRKSTKKFDAVFIDFPFPTSYDLSKLYSVEFYRSLKKIIRPNGYFVFDAPVEMARRDEEGFHGKWPQDILFSTLHAAGLKNIYVYGLIESFYLVSLSESEMKMHFDKLPADLKNKTRVNLYSLNETLKNTEVSKKYVNSIFKPQNFTGK